MLEPRNENQACKNSKQKMTFLEGSMRRQLPAYETLVRFCMSVRYAKDWSMRRWPRKGTFWRLGGVEQHFLAKRPSWHFQRGVKYAKQGRMRRRYAAGHTKESHQHPNTNHNPKTQPNTIQITLFDLQTPKPTLYNSNMTKMKRFPQHHSIHNIKSKPKSYQKQPQNLRNLVFDP